MREPKRPWRPYQHADGGWRVPLTRGYEAKIDESSVGLVSERAWFAMVVGRTAYAASHPHGLKMLLMHREIMRAADGQYTDHKNGDGTDNRVENLRFASPLENQRNRRGRKDHVSSPFKGVQRARGRTRFTARIRVDNKTVHLGCFDDEESAAVAYDEAAVKHFGAFARLNFAESP